MDDHVVANRGKGADLLKSGIKILDFLGDASGFPRQVCAVHSPVGGGRDRHREQCSTRRKLGLVMPSKPAL